MLAIWKLFQLYVLSEKIIVYKRTVDGKMRVRGNDRSNQLTTWMVC